MTALIRRHVIKHCETYIKIYSLLKITDSFVNSLKNLEVMSNFSKVMNELRIKNMKKFFEQNDSTDLDDENLLRENEEIWVIKSVKYLLINWRFSRFRTMIEII